MNDNGFGNQARDNLIVRRLEKEIRDRTLGDKKLEEAINKYAVLEGVDKIIPHYNNNKEIDSVKIFQKNKDERGLVHKIIFDIPVPNKYITDIERLKDDDQLKFYIRTFDNKEGKEKIDTFIYKPDHSTKELWDKLIVEIKRSKEADDKHDDEIRNLNIKLDSEIKRSVKKDEEHDKGIAAEASRAKAAEEQLDKDIDQESKQRQEADKQLNDKINLETIRAELAESGLSKRIDDIESRTDVADIVAVYDNTGMPVPTPTDLIHYDTSKITDNDIIKVLEDNGSRGLKGVSYYRFHLGKTEETEKWELVAAFEPEAKKKDVDLIYDILRLKGEPVRPGAEKVNLQIPYRFDVTNWTTDYLEISDFTVALKESGDTGPGDLRYRNWAMKVPAATNKLAGLMNAHDKQLNIDLKSILTLKDAIVPPGHEKCNLNIPYRFDFEITESGIYAKDYTVALNESGVGIAYREYKYLLPYATEGNPGFMTAQHVTELKNKIDLLGYVPGHEAEKLAYNLPYFFTFEVDAEGATVTSKTISLDNKRTQGSYSLKIPAATQEKAGLMKAPDKKKLDNLIDEVRPTDTTKKYIVTLEYSATKGDWIKKVEEYELK